MEEVKEVLDAVDDVCKKNISRQAILKKARDNDYQIMLLEALSAVNEIEISIYNDDKQLAISKCKEVKKHFREIVKKATK